MPELPEVENIVRKLGPVVSGKTIEDITVFRDKSFQGEADLVLGLPIESVSRRAKFIRFHFPGNQNILSHLKMTGQFIYVDNENRVGGGHPTADWVKELPSRHTRVQLSLSGNATLFFNDQRVFGWLRVLADPEVEALYGKYGPDINTPAASIEYLANKFARTTRPVKIALMDNSIICGVGNIYACDALNLAGISPLRPANSLSLSEIEKLLQSAKQVIDLGIKTGGATVDNYVNLDGFAGSYQNHLQVYGREGEKCYQCGGVIEKIKLGGRGTYYCPHCQV